MFSFLFHVVIIKKLKRATYIGRPHYVAVIIKGNPI